MVVGSSGSGRESEGGAGAGELRSRPRADTSFERDNRGSMDGSFTLFGTVTDRDSWPVEPDARGGGSWGRGVGRTVLDDEFELA